MELHIPYGSKIIQLLQPVDHRANLLGWHKRRKAYSNFKYTNQSKCLFKGDKNKPLNDKHKI